MAKYDMVVVKWHDAHADSGWCSPDDFDSDPYTVTSVGVDVPTKKGHVTLVQSIGQGTLDHILHIPSQMVVEMYVIGVLDVPE